MKPIPTQVGSWPPESELLRVDPLGADAHHDPGRDRRRRAASRRRRGRGTRLRARARPRASRTQDGQHRADQHHRAEHVQEERPERAAEASDHAPGFQIMRTRISERRDAGEPGHGVAAAGRGGARAARRSPCPRRRPAARRACAPSPGACRRRRRARSRSAQRTSAARSRRLQNAEAQLVHEPEPEHEGRDRRRARSAGTTRRIRRSSSAVSLGRSARSASTFRTPAATEPPTRKNAPVMWNIRSHSAVRHGASVRLRADGDARPAPEAPDRDDRGGQLDARPAGGAVAGRDERRRRRSRPTRASSTSTTSAPTSSCCARRTGRTSRR